MGADCFNSIGVNIGSKMTRSPTQAHWTEGNRGERLASGTEGLGLLMLLLSCVTLVLAAASIPRHQSIQKVDGGA